MKWIIWEKIVFVSVIEKNEMTNICGHNWSFFSIHFDNKSYLSASQIKENERFEEIWLLNYIYLFFFEILFLISTI